MKVALLLYGQPRCIENLKTYESHYEHIINKYETDVFCHAWVSKNELFTPSTWSKLAPIKCIDNASELIQQHYSPVISKYEPSMNFDTTLLQKLKIISSHIKPNISNIMSQLYSINMVTNMYERHVNETGKSYDWVIVARYDIIFETFPNLLILDNKFFYVMDHHNRFPDLVNIFNPKFIKSQHTYTNINFIINGILNGNVKEFWEFSPECLKYNNYLMHFNKNDIKGIKIIEHRNVI